MQNVDQIQNEAPILKKTIDLYEEFYEYLKTFPKKDQYVLGKRCEEHIIDFMELIVSAVSLYKQEKKAKLSEANIKFDLLKVLLRMAREFKMLDNKKYLSLEEKIQEIGRMLGGSLLRAGSAAISALFYFSVLLHCIVFWLPPVITCYGKVPYCLASSPRGAFGELVNRGALQATLASSVP